MYRDYDRMYDRMQMVGEVSFSRDALNSYTRSQKQLRSAADDYFDLIRISLMSQIYVGDVLVSSFDEGELSGFMLGGRRGERILKLRVTRFSHLVMRLILPRHVY